MRPTPVGRLGRAVLQACPFPAGRLGACAEGAGCAGGELCKGWPTSGTDLPGPASGGYPCLSSPCLRSRRSRRLLMISGPQEAHVSLPPDFWCGEGFSSAEASLPVIDFVVATMAAEGYSFRDRFGMRMV